MIDGVNLLDYEKVDHEEVKMSNLVDNPELTNWWNSQRLMMWR